MNFNKNLTRRLKITQKTKSFWHRHCYLRHWQQKAIPTQMLNTPTLKVSTASVGNCNSDNIFIIKNFFILFFNTTCTSFTIQFPAMPTSPHNKGITQLNYSEGMCELRPKKAIAGGKVSIPASLSPSTHEYEKREQQSPRTSAAKASPAEMTVPKIKSKPSTQVFKGWVYTLAGKDVASMQVTACKTGTRNSSQQQLHQYLSTKTSAAEKSTNTKKRGSCAGENSAGEKNSAKQSSNTKTPLTHLILTIMTAVVFSMECTICGSAVLQQNFTAMISPNNTHLPTEATKKSAKINNSLQNLPITSTTNTMESTKTSAFHSPASVPPSTPTSTLSLLLPPSQSMKSAAVIQKLSPVSSLTSSSLTERSSNMQTFLSGTATIMHTDSPVLSSLQWEADSGELSLSTSVLSTYDVSDLPPLSEAEQAAKDLLTKGFSIPTYLPPFPVFAVADLPAYLNTVSTTTTESPISHLRPSDGYATNSQENLLYFDNLSEQQLHGMHKNHRGLQIAKKNTSMISANVTVQVGNHAYLPCHIHRLQNKPVSWVRLRDGHIISVDQTTFIADQRFQAIFQDDKEFTWSLQIKYVQRTDQGWYECQASSEPKTSAKVYLKVIVPLTELIGDQSRFVKAGSKVALHCIVRGTLDPPQYIIWYRDKTQISENNIMGWYTQLDRNIFGNNGDNQNTIGSLIIPFVRKMDSGNYTCQPSNSASVSMDLHVLSGEYSASAIMSAARTYTLNDYYLLLLLFLLMLLQKT